MDCRYCPLPRQDPCKACQADKGLPFVPGSLSSSVALNVSSRFKNPQMAPVPHHQAQFRMACVSCLTMCLPPTHSDRPKPRCNTVLYGMVWYGTVRYCMYAFVSKPSCPPSHSSCSPVPGFLLALFRRQGRPLLFFFLGPRCHKLSTDQLPHFFSHSFGCFTPCLNVPLNANKPSSSTG